MLKFVFKRMEVLNSSHGYTQKTLESDILRYLIEKGYEKNNKIIKVKDFKTIKSMAKSEDIYNLTFGFMEDKDDDLDS